MARNGFVLVCTILLYLACTQIAMDFSGLKLSASAMPGSNLNRIWCYSLTFCGRGLVLIMCKAAVQGWASKVWFNGQAKQKANKRMRRVGTRRLEQEGRPV